ncbi:MAG: aminodeoxychorismate/anthranilate synthase component II [Burkholderiaceae bacterium]|nr:aminodeoxychorismate/anthranilate synthase component II [Burkholderiaceae bacterium]
MLLMIDNYDSFTYNLVQYFGELGEDVRVVRNDEVTLDEIARLAPGRICISPGPCSPTEAGISLAAIDRFAGRVPILGVCLGHQAIGQAFGGRVVRARRESLPDCLEVTAWTADGEIMGLRHRSLPVEGVQFHPESIATEHGHAMLRNFLHARLA